MLRLKMMLLVLFCAVVYAQYPIRGSFFMFDRILSGSALSYELGEMKDAGITEIFVVSAGIVSQNGALNPGGLYVGNTNTQCLPDSQGRLKELLDVAAANGQRVYIGSLQTDTDWYQTTWQVPLRQANRAVARDIMTRYGSHPALAGWYFTQEIELNWGKGNPNYYGFVWTGEFVSDMNQLNTEFGKNLVVSAAPIFKKAYGSMPTLTANEFEVVLRQYLQTSGIKLVMPQDGIGANTGGPSLSEISSYWAAAKSAAQSKNAILYADIEVFTASAGSLNSKFPPAPIGRVQQQISAAQPYVSGMVMWNFGHQMSTAATYYPVAARNLQRNYREVYGGLEPMVLIPYTYQYEAVPGVTTSQPSSNWPGSGMSTLNDGVGGGYGGATTDWVGWLDSQSSGGFGLTKLKLTLPAGVKAKKVSILFRSEADSWIVLPQYVSVTESGDARFLGGSLYVAIPDDRNTPYFSRRWVTFNLTENQTNELSLYMSFVGWCMVAEVQVLGTM